MPMSPKTLRPSGGFSPRSIAGLQLWMDATRISSLTFNGSSVSQANDLSGNGRHFTQGTGANQPTYAAAGMNGRPALQFTSSVANRMDSTATIADVFGTPTTSPQSTIFAVMRNVAGVQNACFGSNGDPNGRFIFLLRFNPTQSLVDVVNATDGRLFSPVTQAVSEAAGIHVVFRSGATQTVRTNGAQVVTTASATSNFSTTTATIQVGKALSSLGNEGVFSELLFWNRALSASEIARVELYLSAKYGVTLG
jgi:hypothetical protein